MPYSNQKRWKMSKKEGFLLLFVSILLLALWGAWFLNREKEKDHLVAAIYKDGALYEVVPLSASEHRQISFESNGIPVTLQLEEGTICFIHAQCPDKVCEKTGQLRYERDQAVCLPAQAWVILYKEDQAPPLS